MSKTIIQQVADYVSETDYSRLPAEVVDESKRILLDSIGCALAGTDDIKGRVGTEYALVAGGADGDATIIGSGHRSSVVGAGFANGELINALDFDSLLPPGHVSPYVLPGALAVGESLRSSGRALVTSVAIAHDLSWRMGKAMNYLRDTKGGKVALPDVLGYSSTIIGATAAVSKLQGVPSEVAAHALGIAAAISPVQPQRAWNLHVPSATIKYYAAGPLVQAALAAAYMAQFGHTGDLQVLDDRQYGYARFIGTERWEPSAILTGLGTEWRWPAESTIKLYPHCRVMHTPFDTFIDLLTEHDLKADEIDAVRVWGEGWVQQPVWVNTVVERSHEAQFSMRHGIAVAAQRIRPGKAWHDPELIRSRAVLDLMDKVTVEAHPDYVTAIDEHPAARATRIEIDARGTTFAADRRFPRGVTTPDPTTRATTDEVVEKFRHNAQGIIAESEAEAVVDAVLDLENVDDVSTVIRRLGAVTTGAVQTA